MRASGAFGMDFMGLGRCLGFEIRGRRLAFLFSGICAAFIRSIRQMAVWRGVHV